MKIILFHPSLYPPQDYGGVERVVLWLARGLVELGHEVSVTAFAGSQLPEGVRPYPMEPGQVSPDQFVREIGSEFDQVHFMAPPGNLALSQLQSRYLVTVHGNGKPGEVFPERSVFLSRDHAKRHGHVAFVYNGIDPSEYRFNPAGRKSFPFLFLSKTSWRVKNLRGAMKYCARAGVPLAIAGGNRPFHLRAKAWIHPLFRWEGPVAGLRKASLLANARALLFPIVWEEPFGLVMIEALVSGTPVIASPRGSVPEILTPEVSLQPRTDEEWIEALLDTNEKLSAISPEACRRRVLENFHYLNMAKKYVQYYKQFERGNHP